MLKSPEEYLSGISFDPPESGSHTLTSGERIFVEKYLGMDVMELIPELSPQQVSLHLPLKTLERPKIIEVVQDEPLIAENVSAKEPVLEARLPVEPEKPVSLPVLELEPFDKILEIVDSREKVLDETDTESFSTTKTDTIIIEETDQKIIPKEIQEKQEIVQGKAENPEAQKISVKSAVTIQEDMTGHVEQVVSTPIPTTAVAKPEVSTLPSLREKLKDEPEIQMVSFFISDQLFLLPVIAIQEVLRYQELIKVPQAPDFVAGVINLRGRVTPLVYLSSLLTNSAERIFTEKNFIIICGTPQLQIGLIIDRIKSMHLMPQNKIIWNAEAKLGDAAEFLCAIADLDDKVCGIVAPENIAQKILAP